MAYKILIAIRKVDLWDKLKEVKFSTFACVMTFSSSGIFISPFLCLTDFSLGMNIFHFEAFPLSA
jgi:hypothetical protein